MASRRLLVVLVSGSLVLAVAVAVVISRSPADPIATPSSVSDPADGDGDERPVQPAVPAPFTFRWPAGTVYTYGLTMESAGTIAPIETGAQDEVTSMSATLALEADLALRSYGRLDDRGDTVLGVRLARLTRLDWYLGPQPVLADGGSSLVGPELALVVSPEGTFRSLNVTDEDSPLLVNLFRELLAPLQVVVSPGQRSWTIEQTDSSGDVRVAYEVRADEAARLVLQRRPVEYTQLVASTLLNITETDVAGAYEVVLDRAGHLDSVEGDEWLSAWRADGQKVSDHDMRFEARLLSVTQISAGSDATQRLAGLVATELDDVSFSRDIERIMLERRAGDLTMEELVSDLLVHGPATTFPDVGRWMWQATGLLMLHPELCGELVDVFLAPQMNHRARARVLDLLASTGNPEAQAVLRELLETPEARESNRYDMLVQRLSLVEAPTRETVDYLYDQVEREDGESTLASAHSLGAAIGSRARIDGEVDERSAALLHQGLAEASSVSETVGWLGALGNAGLTDDVSLVASYAADDDPSVRSAVAGALRKTQTPEAEAILFDLVADANSDVQGRALHTLARYELTPDHLADLRRNVESGRLGSNNFAMLLTTLDRNRYQPSAVLPVLETMLEQGVPNQRLRLRIRALQESLSSGR